MTLCHLTRDMKASIRSKMLEINKMIEMIMETIDRGQSCMLCKIKDIRESAYELEVLASYLHFQSSLLPYIEGMDEIAQALAVFSKNRHGALIVVEKDKVNDPVLSAYSCTGVPIDAKVSFELLHSIFYPGGPLHDGAVIIKEGKIVSAGCILPLSKKKYTKKEKRIGTRHKAALGMSEITNDSLVIVVSEETGHVSLAINGVIHPIEVQLCDNLKEYGENSFPLIKNKE